MKLNDFDIFINPYARFSQDYKYLDKNCCQECSYVKYLVVPTINGEINGFAYVVDDIDSIIDEVTIYAINCLDNISLEVV